MNELAEVVESDVTAVARPLAGTTTVHIVSVPLGERVYGVV